MNTTLLLTQFTPAEVHVFEKGFDSSVKDLFRSMLYHFECIGLMRLVRENDANYVEILKNEIDDFPEFELLMKAATRPATPKMLMSHYAQILAETANEDRIIRRILRKLKAGGYFKQSLIGRITGMFELTEAGKRKREDIRAEIKQLRKHYQQTQMPEKHSEALKLLKGNIGFVTENYPDVYNEFAATFQIANRAYQAQQSSGFIGWMSSGGGSDSGCSSTGCGGSGCSGCGGGCGGS
jgi:hypothetical protein